MVSALAFGLFACVDDDYDMPPVPDTIPVGTAITIQQMRDLCAPNTVYRFNEDMSLYAVVTMDDKSGNIYKNSYVQDKTGAVNIVLKSSGSLYQGDSIRIGLKGMKLSWYNNLLQLDTVDIDRNVFKQKTLVDIAPKVVTIGGLKTDLGLLQSQLVKLENVQFVATDTAKTYANAAGLVTENRMLEDASGNQVIVRTSGYAKFAGSNVPNGSGSLVAIVSQYRNDIQLFIRSTSEVDMDGERLGGGGGTGTGTETDPYDVAAAMANQNDAIAWVKGYIVGGIVYDPQTPGGIDYNTTTIDSPDDVVFGADVRNTAVLIADSKTETDYTKCVVVNLPSGAVRSAVNLRDNPANLGKEFKVEGKLRAYFGIPGVRDLTGNYFLEGQTGGGNEDAIFSETFATGQGNFTIENVLKPEVLASIWYHNTQYSQMAAGAYKDGTNHASEAWLISPAIDLSSVSAATFTFEHAGKQFKAPVTNLTIRVSTVYTGGEIKAEDWTEIAIPNHLSGETNTFKSAGDMDLTQYCGNSNVRIAFRYTSTSTGAGNWYVKNVVVK